MLLLRPKNPFPLLLAQYALDSTRSTSRGCGSHLRQKSSLSFTHRFQRTLKLMAVASSTKTQGMRTSILTLLPSKRRRTQSTIASSRPTSSQPSHKPRNSPSPSIHDDGAELPGRSQAKGTQRSHGKSTGKRNPPAPEQASETTAAEVRVLKAELAKARADATAAVALAAEREPSGLGGSTDRLRSRGSNFYADCYKWEERRNLNINVVFSSRGCGCSCHDAATWCIACQTQGNSS